MRRLRHHRSRPLPNMPDFMLGYVRDDDGVDVYVVGRKKLRVTHAEFAELMGR